VYDMYPWDGASPGGRPPQIPPRGHSPEGRTPNPRATDAVQIALDRRDNGGDAAAVPGTPPAGPTRQ
jgi:hypothetical protein